MRGSDYELELVGRSRVLRLYEYSQWRKLLFIVPGWVDHNHTLIGSKDFFLSPQGATDPESELSATLHAFFDPNERLDKSVSPPVSRHAQCRFPARFAWLNEKLGFDYRRLRRLPCQRLEDFISDIDADRVSMVFSSGYMNNPGSMFGHTLFRFHRRPGKSGNEASALLDHAISFAAFPDSKNPIVYAYKGIAGGFPGLFDVLPYFIKIQEYNNHESRDLWEYELSLSPPQVDLMLRSVWEVGAHPIQYFYTDQNCASVLFILLDITDPSYHFSDDYVMWVTPADVVRAILSEPGFIRERHYWPSSLSRYLGRLGHLKSSEERKALKSLFGKDAEANVLLAGLSEEEKVRVIDAALEYIDFSEKLTGSEIPKNLGPLRNRLLSQRAQIPLAPEKLPNPEPRSNPEQAHGSMRLAAGFGYDQGKGSTVGIHWRPVLHDILGNGAGFSDNLEIRFFDITGKYFFSGQKLILHSFSLLEILSLSTLKPLISPLSWRFALAMENDRGNLISSERYMRKFARFGVGLSVSPFSYKPINLYGLVIADAGSSTLSGQSFHVGPGIQAGLLWAPVDSFRLSVGGQVLRRYGSRTLDEWRLNLDGAYYFSRDYEIRIENSLNPYGFESFLSFSVYLG